MPPSLFFFSSNFNTRPKIYYDRHDICLKKGCLILRCSNNDNDNNSKVITLYSLHQSEGGKGGKAFVSFGLVWFGLVLCAVNHDGKASQGKQVKNVPTWYLGLCRCFSFTFFFLFLFCSCLISEITSRFDFSLGFCTEKERKGEKERVSTRRTYVRIHLYTCSPNKTAPGSLQRHAAARLYE